MYNTTVVSCCLTVNNELISESEVEVHLSRVLALAADHQIPATFFELTTLMAFAHFAARQVDYAVIEVGIGGRLDATNIITPDASVIVSIGLDHTDILGPTVEHIAREKAGIIKPGAPVVIGPSVPRHVIRPVAAERQSPVHEISDVTPNFEVENELVCEREAVGSRSLHTTDQIM